MEENLRQSFISVQKLAFFVATFSGSIAHMTKQLRIKLGPSGDWDPRQSKIETTVKGHTNDDKSFSNFPYLIS